MQVYIRIFLAFIRIYWNICITPVINQLWPAGPADIRMHDRPARPMAFCWKQNCPRICGEKHIGNIFRSLFQQIGEESLPVEWKEKTVDR